MSVSTLYIHIPGTPTLLVVVRFLASESDPGISTGGKKNPAKIPANASSSDHCMSSYRKVTNERRPSYAMMTWNVFFCNKELINCVVILFISIIINLSAVRGRDLKPRCNEQVYRSEGRLQVREGSVHFTGRS